jgi:Flp pilus assembly protein CpaB
VLAAHDLAVGATIRADDVRVVRRPAATVGADAVREPAVAVGRLVRVALLRDDVVGARHLVPAASDVVPDGTRAVHIVVKDGFRPPPGSVVDVLAAYDPAIASGTGAPGRASVVARGARVLALASAVTSADPAATGDGSGDTTGAGVTVLVNEDEARAVAYAAAIGQVMLALAPVRAACCGGPPS